MVLLDPQERLNLHSEVRDQDPDVWEPACHRLGELAATDQVAYKGLCELLLSSVPELRLKGLVALRFMAPTKPDDVLGFLTDLVDESRRNFDPIMLDTAFFVFTALPGQLGRDAVAEYLKDESESVRSGATAALAFWSDWPDGTLTSLAQDSSLLVRASLITALPEIQDSADKRRAIELLHQQSEPELAELLAELSAPPSEDLDLPVFEALTETEARDLMVSAAPQPVLTAQLEQSLADEPKKTLDFLRKWIEAPGATMVLNQLGDLSRERSFGVLLKSWAFLISPPKALSDLDATLALLGILDEEPESQDLTALRAFVLTCAEAIEAECIEDMVCWSGFEQTEIGEFDLSLHPRAWESLGKLSKVASEFEGMSLFRMSTLVSELEKLKHRIEDRCPRPERNLLLRVVETWRQIVEKESLNLMGGGSVG